MKSGRPSGGSPEGRQGHTCSEQLGLWSCGPVVLRLGSSCAAMAHHSQTIDKSEDTQTTQLLAEEQHPQPMQKPPHGSSNRSRFSLFGTQPVFDPIGPVVPSQSIGCRLSLEMRPIETELIGPKQRKQLRKRPLRWLVDTKRQQTTAVFNKQEDSPFR